MSLALPAWKRATAALPHIWIPDRNRIWRLGPFAFTLDLINDIECGRLVFVTAADMEHRRDGRLLARMANQPGVLTIGFANQLVGQAVTGTTAIPYLAACKYCAYGTTGTPAPADGDTTPVGNGEGTQARATFTLTNAQTATTGNHAAKLQYATGAITITVAATYTEFWLVDTASGAVTNTMDHRAYSPSVAAAVNDTLATTYTLTISSNV